jgi:hypothetical protein
MDDTYAMNILNPWQDLLHIGNSFLFLESLFSDDVVEELPSRGVFHDEVDVRFGLNDLHRIENT